MTGISGKGHLRIVGVALFFSVAALTLGLIDWDKRLSSRVLDLLPSANGSLEHRFMVGVLRERQADQVRFAVIDLPDHQQDAATEFVEAFFERTGLFVPEILTDREVIDRLSKRLYEDRLPLLFPHWLAERAKEWSAQGEKKPFHDWLAGRSADDLDRFLNSPIGFFYSDLVAGDPLLLLLGLKDLVMEGTGSERGQSVRTAQLAGSAFDPENQSLVAEAVTELEMQLSHEFPGSRLLVSGPVLFAGHSRNAIRTEVRRINVVSAFMVILAATICLKNPIGLIFLLPVIACGLVGGLIGVVYFFGHVHVLSLVMGAFLAGITVDYGFHAFMNQEGTGKNHLWRPLCTAAGSTGAGFAVLLFATLPVIRQLGLFVTAGSICALFAAITLRPVVRSRFVDARATLTRNPVWSKPGRRTVLLIVILMGGMAFGVFRIEWHDDIRELDLPSPRLQANDKALRDMAGGSEERTTFLTTGSSFLNAIDHYRAFEVDWMKRTSDKLAGLASVLPTTVELSAVRQFMKGDVSRKWLDALALELVRIGYDTSAFDPFLQKFARLRMLDFQESRVEIQLVRMSELLVGPASFLVVEADGIHAVASIAPQSFMDPARDGEPEFHTIVVSQLENLNQVFSCYRREVWGFLLAGFSVVAIGVMAIYRPTAGIKILLLPIGSTLTAFGILGWTIQGLNLFHLLAGLLGFCLALDYSLFAWETRQRRAPPPVSVRISGLTTLAAFGALATSRLPAVSALGMAVGLIVLVTLILVEVFGGPKTVIADHVSESKMG